GSEVGLELSQAGSVLSCPGCGKRLVIPSALSPGGRYAAEVSAPTASAPTAGGPTPGQIGTAGAGVSERPGTRHPPQTPRETARGRLRVFVGRAVAVVAVLTVVSLVGIARYSSRNLLEGKWKATGSGNHVVGGNVAVVEFTDGGFFRTWNEHNGIQGPGGY